MKYEDAYARENSSRESGKVTSELKAASRAAEPAKLVPEWPVTF